MSNIKKKSREEIKLMKRAGHIVALCHKKVRELIEPGINTLEIDNLIVNITKENKVCGCKTCSIDAVMFNRLGDYLTDLENRFENLSKEENYLENKVKLKNIKSNEVA